mmetsp:Transcript_25384/g.47250  ORF Transcript_25384/g.47250 Transcript_25384/m.47250 type:complete len:254 (-) Transcript_25384:208-969(-)
MDGEQVEEEEEGATHPEAQGGTGSPLDIGSTGTRSRSASTAALALSFVAAVGRRATVGIDLRCHERSLAAPSSKATDGENPRRARVREGGSSSSALRLDAPLFARPDARLRRTSPRPREPSAGAAISNTAGTGVIGDPSSSGRYCIAATKASTASSTNIQPRFRPLSSTSTIAAAAASVEFFAPGPASDISPSARSYSGFSPLMPQGPYTAGRRRPTENTDGEPPPPLTPPCPPPEWPYAVANTSSIVLTVPW